MTFAPVLRVLTRSLALLALLLAGPAVAQPASAALADSVLGLAMGQQAERLADVRDIALVGDAFTVYARVGWRDGSPVVTQRFVTEPGFPADFLGLVIGDLVFFAAEEDSGGADEAAAARYLGIVPLDGRPAHHIEGVFYEDGTPMDIAMWLGVDSLLLRQAVLTGPMEVEPGRRAHVEIRMAWDAFRLTGPLLLPHRARFSIDGFASVLTREERERLAATLDFLLATLKAMPPDQRREAEPAAAWQVGLLRDLYFGRPVTLDLEIREVRINDGLPEGLFDETDPTGGYH